MKEIHLEKKDKIKDIAEEKSLKIYGELTKEDIEILKSLHIKQLDLNNLTNTSLTGFVSFDHLTSIKLPKDLESILYRCFLFCGNLEVVDASECLKLTVLPKCCFENCKNLLLISLPKSLTTIHNNAFYNCNRLEFIDLPNSISVIEKSTFSCCKALKTIKLPQSLKRIEAKLFDRCSSLKKIEIPELVEYIEKDAFCGCNSLTEIIINDKNKHFCIENGALINKEKTILYRFFIRADNYIIPNTIEIIKDYAFECCSLKTITIPKSIVNLGSKVFHNCSSLVSVEFEQGINITEIPQFAFNNCSSLKKIDLPNFINNISENAFSNCTSLRHVRIHSSINYIATYAFLDCTFLKLISYDDNIDFENDMDACVEGFSGCKSFSCFKVPEKLVQVCDGIINKISKPHIFATENRFIFCEYFTTDEEFDFDCDNLKIYGFFDGSVYYKEKDLMIQSIKEFFEDKPNICIFNDTYDDFYLYSWYY